MSKDPAFLFYSSDFSTGTQFFTDEQVGKYIRILIAQHQHGHLTEKQMRILCGGIADQEIYAKFSINNEGKYFNKRLDAEVVKRKNHSEKQKENANMRWHKSGIALAMPLENENRNKDIIINKDKKENKKEQSCEVLIYPTFDDFWNEYDKKADKPKSQLLWNKLSQDEKESILKFIPQYKLSQPEKQFRKDPTTFLRNRSWENEIIIKQNGNTADEKQRGIQQLSNLANQILRAGIPAKPES